MGLESNDYDFLISGISKDEIESYLQSRGRIVAETDRQTAVYKFVPEGTETVFDLALPRRERYERKSGRKPTVELDGVSIEDDLSRRDLTINAVALPVFGPESAAIDPFCGLSDIQERKIRTVGNPKDRFSEDPLRMLRVVRFACRFGFDVEPNTFESISEMKDLVKLEYENNQGETKSTVSSERISKELAGAINANPGLFLKLYDQSGLLEILLPEVSAMKGIKQPEQFHSEGDVFVHTEKVLSNLPADASLELELATILHDIGKVKTYQSAEETGDRIRFNDHDMASAEMAGQILKRYKFPKNVAEKVIWLIQHHMIPLVSFSSMRLNRQKKLVRDERFLDLVRLAVADAQSSLRPDGTVDLNFLESIKMVLSLVEQESTEGKPVEIISGNAIIEIIKKINPQFDSRKDGRIIGRIKKQVNQAYGDGEIKDAEEAEAMAEQIASQILSENID